MIDSHCHIQFKGYKDDYKQVVKRCSDKNCTMITVGTQKDTSQKAIKFAKKYQNIYATIGLHPIHLFPTHVDEEESSFLSREEKFDHDYYKKLAEHPKVVGIGECGIDLFHIPKNIERKIVVEKQKQVFLQQINLAQELNLPVAIHIRSAHDETIKFLQDLEQKPAGVVHCYSSNWLNAEKYLNMGLYVGFTGIITFPAKKSDPQTQADLLEVVRKCPLDKILIETDAPYLAPQTYRGQRCEPWMVEEVAKKVAEVKHLPLEEVVKITEQNTKKLFTKIN
ncbi:MAG: TatD family hydrolase [bacterium]